MIPCAVMYWLVASKSRLKPYPNAGLEDRALSEHDLDEVSSLDRHVLGYSRAADHRWWMQTTRGHIFHGNGRMVGYAYVDEGWIAPALAIDEPTLVAIFGDLGPRVSADEIETAVLGTSRTLFQALIQFGFRIGKSKYSSVYASNTGPLPQSYVLHADWLP